MPGEKPARHPEINTNPYMNMLCKGEANQLLDEFEEKIQKEMIRTLENVGIKASVKRDKFSLPYTEEKVVVVPFVSYLNAVFKYSKAFRIFVKELLDDEIRHIRFYIWTDMFQYDNGEEPRKSGLKHYFRYYVHH